MNTDEQFIFLCQKVNYDVFICSLTSWLTAIFTKFPLSTSTLDLLSGDKNWPKKAIFILYIIYSMHILQRREQISITQVQKFQEILFFL